MDNFVISDFLSVINPEPQAVGKNSKIVEFTDHVECTIGTAPTNGSTYSREKYRLETSYKLGDDFWIWETVTLPDNFYSLQNGSMRLIGLWNNTQRGRIGLWIDSSHAPRLQMEKSSGSLVVLWRGSPRQISVGKRQIALHIVLGSLTELYIDGNLYASVKINNLPYSTYSPNQILFFLDGANANTKVITVVGHEIGAGDNPPFVEVNPCLELESAYEAVVTSLASQQIVRDAVYSSLIVEQTKLDILIEEEATLLVELTSCRNTFGG